MKCSRTIDSVKCSRTIDSVKCSLATNSVKCSRAINSVKLVTQIDERERETFAKFTLDRKCPRPKFKEKF